MLEKWKKCFGDVSVWEMLACTMIWPLDHKAWCVFVCFLCGFTFQVWCCFSSTFCRECCKSFPDSLNLDLKSAAKTIRMLLAARFDRLFWLFLLYIYIGKYMIFLWTWKCCYKAGSCALKASDCFVNTCSNANWVGENGLGTAVLISGGILEVPRSFLCVWLGFGVQAPVLLCCFWYGNCCLRALASEPASCRGAARPNQSSTSWTTKAFGPRRGLLIPSNSLPQLNN